MRHEGTKKNTVTRLTGIEQTLKALADRTRLRILGLLLNGEICVCHIHESLEVPQPTASRHLAYLRRAGLVETRKDGLWVYYRLATPADRLIRTLVGSATHCLCHLPGTRTDRARLEKRVTLSHTEPEPPVLACCEAVARGATRRGKANGRRAKRVARGGGAPRR
ncbi:MAG: winged helix-turn-helix transcriptional regulator [Acidobacteria bacterium]|nr:winged helix-turn-helix transcriptional regulator [Acidobacteriota bacterium]